jgi:hypothetical protein
MPGSTERLRGSVWDHLERLEPVAEVVPHYDEIVPDLNAGTPVVLTDGGTRVAVIVAWDMWIRAARAVLERGCPLVGALAHREV